MTEPKDENGQKNSKGSEEKESLSLGTIYRIDEEIGKAKIDQLQLLHNVNKDDPDFLVTELMFINIFLVNL